MKTKESETEDFSPYAEHVASIIFLQNIGAGGNESKNGVEVKSRDIGSLVSTPSKRKSKKKLEAASSQISSADTQTQTSGDSSGLSFNIILGVALVSVIIGVILGKRY